MSIFGAQFDKAVADIKTSARDFTDAYNRFIVIPATYRGPKWASAYNLATATRATIETLTQAIDSINRGFMMSGMGFFPVAIATPAALVAIAGAAISAIMYSTGKMREAISESQTRQAIAEENIRLSREGKPPLSADAYPAKSGGIFDSIGGALANMGNVIKWAALGYGAYLIVTQLSKRGK